MDIGILSYIIFTPMVAAFVLMVLKVDAKTTRNFAFFTGIVVLLLSAKLFLDFRPVSYMQFIEYHPWIESYGISYYVGIDGFSLVILILIAVLVPFGYLLLWEGRTKGYWISMMLIESGMLGTLFSLDLMLFYFFWETMVLPVFLIIGMFGHGEKVFSTLKFTIYTISGSLFMLIAILYLGISFHNEFDLWSFQLIDIAKITILSPTEKFWLFWAFMLAFAVKIPLFPFHGWLLETYKNAPTGGVFLLSSFMAKLGVYGVIRFVMPIFPELFKEYSSLFVWLGLFDLVYFGIAALMQDDLKKMFAYSSASHLGFIVAGIFALNEYAMLGALFLIIAHAMATGGIFLLAGKFRTYIGTFKIDKLGGIAQKAPLFTIFFAVMLLSIVGLPGTNGFVAEFMIVLGIFKRSFSMGFVSATTVIVAASFMFWMFQRAILQDTKNDTSNMEDLKLYEAIGLLPIVIIIVVMGVYPDIFTVKIEPTIYYYLHDILKVGV
ncbi:MAG: NADH-quinone oxidoreductase subunit M [Epsilonproteobacteria bacterium]|nr:NADH-quinone oxidoreductase subunit M [Campylobacterota bacterium]